MSTTKIILTILVSTLLLVYGLATYAGIYDTSILEFLLIVYLVTWCISFCGFIDELKRVYRVVNKLRLRDRDRAIECIGRLIGKCIIVLLFIWFMIIVSTILGVATLNYSYVVFSVIMIWIAVNTYYMAKPSVTLYMKLKRGGALEHLDRPRLPKKVFRLQVITLAMVWIPELAISLDTYISTHSIKSLIKSMLALVVIVIIIVLGIRRLRREYNPKSFSSMPNP